MIPFRLLFCPGGGCVRWAETTEFGKRAMAKSSAAVKKAAVLEGLVQVLTLEEDPYDPRPPASNPGRPQPGPALHQPVMLEEVLELLAVRPDGIYLDLTVGTAGHAREILARLGPRGLLVGLDRDPETLEVARRRLQEVGAKAPFRLWAGDFGDLLRICRELGLGRADGILADLGMSSWQLDSPERGFSHALEGPLDMRFDRREPTTAAELIRRCSAEELTGLLRRYGEEPFARRIARAVAERARRAPIRTTVQLAEVIREVVPARARADALARTFQALRIAVNRELESLERLLRAAPGLLAPGGRLVVISFHSLEDRLVKRALREGERAGLLRVLTPKPRRPDPEEVRRNPRSRSARLRGAEKLLLSGPAQPQGGDR